MTELVRLAAWLPLLLRCFFAPSAASAEVPLDRTPWPSDPQHATALLQLQRRHVKQAPACTGIESDGRCWYLSDKGQDCQTTCQKHGRAFKFATPKSDENPVIYQLLGKHPTRKMGPYFAFECYMPDQDRSHLVSSCSANDYRDTQGSWSHEQCQLACPCGGVKECQWKQAEACEGMFVYRGNHYSGCPALDREGVGGGPWCQHDHDDESEWSRCLFTCIDATGRETIEKNGDSVAEDDEIVSKIPLEPSAVVTTTADVQTTSRAPAAKDDDCFWALAEGCVPEFNYGGSHLTGCARVNHHTPWCSLSDPFDASWRHCIFSCPKVSPALRNEVAAKNVIALQDDLLCGWQLAADCKPRMRYQDMEVEGCTDLHTEGDYKWCSHDDVYAGHWSACVSTCSRASSVPSER